MESTWTFHHSMWNLAIPSPFHMESRWNGDPKMSGISAKTYSIWSGGFHMDSMWNKAYSRWIPCGIRGESKDLDFSMTNLCSFAFCTDSDGTHVTKCPLWLASIIWHSSLCFYDKPCVFDAGIMLHHATSLFENCADAPDTLCQSFWSSSALLVQDTCNRSRVLPSLVLRR